MEKMETPIYESVVTDLGDVLHRTIQIRQTHAQMKREKSKAWKLTNKVWNEIADAWQGMK